MQGVEEKYLGFRVVDNSDAITYSSKIQAEVMPAVSTGDSAEPNDFGAEGPGQVVHVDPMSSDAHESFLRGINGPPVSCRGNASRRRLQGHECKN